MQRAIFLVVLLVGFMLGVQGPVVRNSLGKIMPRDAAPLEKQVYYFMADEPTSLDVSINLYVGQWNDFLFERLLALDENNDLIPAAAERWEVSPDRKKWTFYLRKTARWSDGHPATAHDYEYSFKRFLRWDIGNPYGFFYYDIKGAESYHKGLNKDPDSLAIKAIDDYTLVLETNQPAPYLGYVVAFPTSHPVPRWQVEKYGPKWTETGYCVTNSSYQLVEWAHNYRMIFTLNPYYDGPNKGYLEKIIRHIQHPSTANILPYENDEVGTYTVSATELPRVKADPVLSRQLVSNLADATWYIFFKTRQAPFNDLRVRQAISHAIDREALCNIVLKGAGVPAYSMLTPRFEAYADYQDRQAYNPELGRQLMAEAGFPGGRGFPKVDFWLREAGPETRLVGEAIQGMLKQNLGIELNIRSADYPVFTEKLFSWKLPMGFMPFFADYRDPKNMLDMIWRPRSVGYGRHDWHHDRFLALLNQADQTLDNQLRTDLYRQAESILVSEAGGVFVYHPVVYTLYKPWLKGLKKNRFGEYRMLMTNIYIGK